MSTDNTDGLTAIDVRLAADLTVIRPGDTVLVRMRRDTPREELFYVAESLRDRMPGVDVLMLRAEGVEVYRPSADQPDPDAFLTALAECHRPKLEPDPAAAVEGQYLASCPACDGTRQHIVRPATDPVPECRYWATAKARGLVTDQTTHAIGRH